MSYRLGYGSIPRILFGSLLCALLVDLLCYAVYSSFSPALPTQTIAAFLLLLLVLFACCFGVLSRFDSSSAQLHPAHMVDLAHALKWMIQYSRSFGADGSQMYLCGHGVGASMVALLAHHDALLAEVGLDRDKLETCIKGVVGLGGLYDPLALRDAESPLAFVRRHAAGLHLFGYRSDQLEQASVVAQLKQTCIPYLLLTPERCAVPLAAQAEALRLAMQRLHIRVEQHSVPGTDQSSLVRKIGCCGDAVLKLILDFITAEGKQAA